MPTYRFQCKKCDEVYEDLTSYDETGKYKDVKCPKCNSKKKNQLATACNFLFSNPVGSDRWTSDGTGHDYRYNYNRPKVKKQREMAEKASHMGTQPYSDLGDIHEGEGVRDNENPIKL